MEAGQEEEDPSYIHIGGLCNYTDLDSWIQSWTLYLLMVYGSYDKIFSSMV